MDPFFIQLRHTLSVLLNEPSEATSAINDYDDDEDYEAYQNIGMSHGEQIIISNPKSKTQQLTVETCSGFHFHTNAIDGGGRIEVESGIRLPRDGWGDSC